MDRWMASTLVLGRDGLRRRVAKVDVLREDVPYIKEGSALQADVHKRRLHPRKDTHDFSEVDVPYEPALITTINVKFGKTAVLHDGHARLASRRIADNFGTHWILRCPTTKGAPARTIADLCRSRGLSLVARGATVQKEEFWPDIS